MPIPAGSRYVAMGSSFAAGPGLPSRVPGSPRRAGRSTGNYAHLVARELGLDLHDVTFSGATTSDLLGPSAAGQAAQLDAVTAETSLVTITAGGNDVGFVPRLTLASLPWPLRLLPPVKARVESLGQIRATDQRFEQLERNLAVIAARLRDRAPACRVVVVDYLSVLPQDGPDPEPPPRAEITTWGRALGRVRRSPCLVGGAVDAALPPVPARGSAVPPERGRDGGGRRARGSRAKARDFYESGGSLMMPAHQPGQDIFRSVDPEDIDWQPFPAFPPPARLAVVVGKPTEPGPYVIRVKVPSGVKLMPHRHPEDRVYTVISGVFYIGVGEEFDDGKLEAHPPGAVVVLPGGTPHFHWAKSGEYVTQVTAIGPLGLEYLDPENDPRNA
jgi:lysophospholipase L1-like esterase/quercetin dioxygenase-like cupin family protein